MEEVKVGTSVSGGVAKRECREWQARIRCWVRIFFFFFIKVWWKFPLTSSMIRPAGFSCYDVLAQHTICLKYAHFVKRVLTIRSGCGSICLCWWRHLKLPTHNSTTQLADQHNAHTCLQLLCKCHTQWWWFCLRHPRHLTTSGWWNGMTSSA